MNILLNNRHFIEGKLQTFVIDTFYERHLILFLALDLEVVNSNILVSLKVLKWKFWKMANSVCFTFKK